MNAIYIITTYVVLDDTLRALRLRDHHHATLSTAEILTVAVIAARYFRNNHERALFVLHATGWVGRMSASRFNRRLHQALDTLHTLLEVLRDQRLDATFYVIDTMPLPACHKSRAPHCRKLPRLKGYLGRCAAKGEWFCGWRLHWLVDRRGFPIAWDMLPAVWHELTPLHELLAPLPAGSIVLGDGAYISRQDAALALQAGIRLVAQHHARMSPNSPLEQRWLATYRNVIETAHAQLQRMGVQQLHARTALGFGIKVYASILALMIPHFIRQFTGN
jgi:hypothetical protein